MSDLFEKMNKIVDAVTDILVEDVSVINEEESFSYNDLNKFVRTIRVKYPSIQYCLVSLNESKTIGEKVYPEKKFIVRIVMLDSNKKPLIVSKEDEYVGKFIAASSIDKKLFDLMKGETERIIKLKNKEGA